MRPCIATYELLLVSGQFEVGGDECVDPEIFRDYTLDAIARADSFAGLSIRKRGCWRLAKTPKEDL